MESETKTSKEEVDFLKDLNSAFGTIEEKIYLKQIKRKKQHRPKNFPPIEIDVKDSNSLHAKVFYGDLKSVKEELLKLNSSDQIYDALAKELNGANVLYYALFSQSSNRAAMMELLLEGIKSYTSVNLLVRDLDCGHWNLAEIILERNFLDLWGALLRSFHSDSSKLKFILTKNHKGESLAGIIISPKLAEVYLKTTILCFASEKTKYDFLTVEIDKYESCIFNAIYQNTPILVDVIKSISQSTVEDLLHRLEPHSKTSYIHHLASDVIHEDLCSCRFDRFFEVMMLLPKFIKLQILNHEYDECIRCSNTPNKSSCDYLFPVTPFKTLLIHCGRVCDIIHLLKSLDSKMRLVLLEKKNKDGLTPLQHAIYTVLIQETIAGRRALIEKIGSKGNAFEHALKMGHLEAISLMTEMIA